MSRCSPFIFGVGCYGSGGGGGGGGATLTIEIYSDAGATIPITSSDYGETIYIKATATATQENFTLFIDNGDQSLLPVVAIDNSATHVFEYTINLADTLDIYVIASDATNGIADNEPFVFTVTSVYPPSVLGNVLWIDAAKAATYNLNGANVAQLNDLSGLSHHLVSPSAGNDPLYLPEPNGINGLRGTRFSNGKRMYAGGITLDTISGNSFFAVARFNTSASSQFAFTNTFYSDNTPYFVIEQSGANIKTYSFSGGYSSSVPIALSTALLIEVHRTNTSEQLLINGVAKFTRAIGTTGTNGGIWFASNGSNYDLEDVAIFNGALSTTDKDAIRTFLMTKWNIV